MESSLRNPQEVAEYLGTTTGALAQMRYRGLGPKFIKTGSRSVRYRVADIESWLESQTRQPGVPQHA